MRKFILALIIPATALAGGNPLLEAPATDAKKWEGKLKEFERPELPSFKEYPKPFHSPNSYRYQLNDVCSACHTFAAHKKDKKYAPFYNAHGTFMSCNVCHFVKEGVKYSWGEVKGGKVILLDKGDFYGLKYIKAGTKIILSGQDSKARIVPVYNGIPVELPLKGNEGLMKDKVAISKMHNGLTKEALKCEDCHKKGGRINFKELGFNPQRVKDLEENEVVKGLKEYETIHFPKFIW